jgi:hypothetical protein
MTPTQPLTVTLEAQQWEQVMRLLADGPYRVVAPLIQAIQQQCMAASARLPTNGADDAPQPAAQP